MYAPIECLLEISYLPLAFTMSPALREVNIDLLKGCCPLLQLTIPL